MKNLPRLILLLICIFLLAFHSGPQITLPLGGNSWLSGNGARLSNEGVTQWKDPGTRISVYFRAESTGEVALSLKARIPGGKSTIKLTVAGQSFEKTLANPVYEELDFGTVKIEKTGYVNVVIEGITKTGDHFAEISDLVIRGAATTGAAYVRDNEGNFFHWGRRGPSVHLRYDIPAEYKQDTEWFYNEITVPVGNDVRGSYYMANGFNGGYFGMQVNSETERRVLFSIWSPYQTDDPKSIPDSMKIILLKKGENVRTGEFGNEGSGGQSYMVYPWKAGKTYGFLSRAEADPVKGNTTYTAYFKDPEKPGWQLIASFRRPKSGTYFQGLYSFLENFNPATGNTQRLANYGNQWIRNTKGEWLELTQATFTGDNTARKNYRKDYGGGVDGKAFFMRNCGFFNDFTTLNTPLKRTATGKTPVVDFKTLP